MKVADNICDGFSAPEFAQKIEFTKIPDSQYLSLLRESPSKINFTIPESVTRIDHTNIACPDGRFKLQADIYYQDKDPAETRPCIIFMHDWAGGRNPMICGDRQGCFFALRGYMFVALYYRPPRYAPCPAALEDLKTAVRWIRSQAGEYSIDDNKIIVMGSSAGSQWAFMGAATNGDRRFETHNFNEFSSKINMVMMHSSICDVVKDFKDTEIMRTIFNCTYEQNQGMYREFSPAHNIKQEMPPVIMINGDLDRSCSIEAARNLRNKLQACGCNISLIELQGRDHGSTGFPGDLFLKLNKYDEFIRDNWQDAAVLGMELSNCV